MADADNKGPPIITALLMERDTFPMDRFLKSIAGRTLGGHKVAAGEVKKGTWIATVGDEITAVAPMPVPYPWKDLEGPCKTSWMWPKDNPAIDLKRHRSHVLVTMIGGKSPPIARRLAMTKLTALAAQVPGVIGVYWAEGAVVHFPPVFLKMAAQAIETKTPSLYLWVDFRIFKNPDGTSGLFTTGMRPLGAMEIEIPRIAMQPRALHEFVTQIAGYLLENGHKVKDGHTIGLSAEQQIRVRHVPSVYGKKETVMRLEA